MPFVKHLFPEAKVVPLMVPPVSTADEVGEAVARTLEAYDYDAVIIGTTDLTHYGPNYGFTPQGVGSKGNAWAKEVRETIDARTEVMTKALAFMANSSVASAFVRWRSDTEQAQRAQALQRRIVMRLRNGILFRCFEAWAADLRDEVTRRTAILKGAVMRMAQACLVQTFESWVALARGAVEAREERERRARAMAARLISPYRSLTFEAWKE